MARRLIYEPIIFLRKRRATHKGARARRRQKVSTFDFQQPSKLRISHSKHLWKSTCLWQSQFRFPKALVFPAPLPTPIILNTPRLHYIPHRSNIKLYTAAGKVSLDVFPQYLPKKTAVNPYQHISHTGQKHHFALICI